jgi:hypothetical protein
VLFEYTRVSPDSHIDEQVVCKDYCVSREGKMKHVSECVQDVWRDARDRRSTTRSRPDNSGGSGSSGDAPSAGGSVSSIGERKRAVGAA